MPAVGWLWPSDDADDIGGGEEKDGDDADDADVYLKSYIICAPSFDVQPA